MIVYLDTSALVAGTEYVVTSVITYPECRSAIARGARSRRVDGAAAARSLDHVWASVHTLDVDLRLSARAGDLASRHLLRGIDALHLACALELADGELPVAFATFDRDLAAAARKEGLDIPLALR